MGHDNLVPDDQFGILDVERELSVCRDVTGGVHVTRNGDLKRRVRYASALEKLRSYDRGRDFHNHLPAHLQEELDCHCDQDHSCTSWSVREEHAMFGRRRQCRRGSAFEVGDFCGCPREEGSYQFVENDSLALIERGNV